MSAVRPTQLEIVDDQLQISWSDEVIRRYTFREVRDACPCASAVSCSADI